MNYLQWIQKLDKNQIRGSYLILVSEPFLWDAMKKIIQDDILQGKYLEFNYQTFDFLSMSIEDFIAAAETLPFFQKQKALIVEHMPLERDQVKENEEKLLALAKYLKKANRSSLIFLSFDGAKPFKGKAYRALEPSLQIIQLTHLKERELKSFIIKRFQSKGFKMEKVLLPFLIERSQYLSRPKEVNLYHVANMVDALANLAEDGKVTLEDGEALFKDPVEDNIFKLMDAISQRNVEEALSLMVGFTQIKEDPIRLFYMTARQIRNLIGIKILKERKIPRYKGQKILRLSSFEYQKLEKAVDNFSLEELYDLYERLFQMEISFKTRSYDMILALEVFYGSIAKSN